MTIPSCAGVTTSRFGGRLDPLLGALGEVDPAVDRGAEGVEPERVERQPQLQRARAAAELRPAVAEVDLVVARDVAQVLAEDRERALERARVADERAARLVGLEEPLVRVEDDGVRVAEPRRAPPAVSTAGAP